MKLETLYYEILILSSLKITDLILFKKRFHYNDKTKNYFPLLIVIFSLLAEKVLTLETLLGDLNCAFRSFELQYLL